MRRNPVLTLLLLPCWFSGIAAPGTNWDQIAGPLGLNTGASAAAFDGLIATTIPDRSSVEGRAEPPCRSVNGAFTDQIPRQNEGVPVGASGREAANVNAGVAGKSGVATGVRPILVLGIEFRDYRAPFGIGYLDSLMNINVLNPMTGLGGFRDYYVENSYGQFIPESHVYGWFEAEHSLSFYADASNGKKASAKRLVEEALEQANAAGVDFSRFALDDGTAGTVMLFTPVRIDAHFGRLNPRIEYQGVLFDSYTIHETSLGVAVHEYGHALGLPDMYGGPSPFGYYDIMGSPVYGNQPGHFSAYSKILLGWIQPVVIDEPVSGLVVPNSHDNPFAVFIRGRNGTEWGYFVIENRAQKGYDGGKYGTVSGSGLLIYHIHEYSNGWSHVEQADGREDLEAYHSSGGWEGNRGDAGDFFPGTTQNTRFDLHSNPSSCTKNGTDTGVAISNISARDDVMTMDVSFPVPIHAESGLDSRHGFELHPNYPNPFRTATIIGYDLPQAAEVEVSVFDLAGRKVAILEYGWKPHGSHQVSFEAGSLPSGQYIYKLRAGEFEATGIAQLVH